MLQKKDENDRNTSDDKKKETQNHEGSETDAFILVQSRKKKREIAKKYMRIHQKEGTRKSWPKKKSKALGNPLIVLLIIFLIKRFPNDRSSLEL